jgi:hypothetical protein
VSPRQGMHPLKVEVCPVRNVLALLLRDAGDKNMEARQRQLRIKINRLLEQRLEELLNADIQFLKGAVEKGICNMSRLEVGVAALWRVQIRCCAK